jgi:hypothetical protein
MWCIPKVDAVFLERMENLLNLYALPYNPLEPVVNVDEASKQLLADSRPALPLRAGHSIREDAEYVRNGTQAIFLAVEAKGGRRYVSIRDRRTAKEFACFTRRLLHKTAYRKARKVHLVVDNLNTHFEKSFYAAFSNKEARTILKKIQFHYTPVHASWLNMAEIELSILSRQCLNRRVATKAFMKRIVRLWQARRNRRRATIQWKFTVKDARSVFKDYYPTNSVE